jgi:hypothetical protein
VRDILLVTVRCDPLCQQSRAIRVFVLAVQIDQLGCIRFLYFFSILLLNPSGLVVNIDLFFLLFKYILDDLVHRAESLT